MPSFLALIVAVLAAPLVAAPVQDLSDFDWARLGPYITRHHRALDWKELAQVPEPVLYFGEDHASRATRIEFAAHMKDLAAGGVTHLAMEMVDDVDQDLLDDYQAGRKRREDLLKLLANHEWSGEYDAEYYVRVMEEAHRAGLKLFGLNMLYDAHYQIDENVAYNCRDRANTSRPCDLVQSVCTHYDCWQASNLAQLLKAHPRARVAVLIGMAHVHPRAQPRYLWEERAIASRIYRFGQNKAYTQARGRLFIQELSRLGLSWRPIFLPVPREQALYDGFIFTPEIENEALWSKP